MEESMAKLIQICASQNDLFGLDDDGRVYQYNFNTSAWMRLGRGRSTQPDAPSADGHGSPAPTSPRGDSGESATWR
jgi:hypothetical protein